MSRYTIGRTRRESLYVGTPAVGPYNGSRTDRAARRARQFGRVLR